MNNYVILSHKPWNNNLAKKLKKEFPQDSWNLINKKEDFTYDKLKEINPSKIFVPHWSFIIPGKIFDNFACIVFHMTDLPFGRGGSPLQNLIARKYTSTKITAIKVVKELDAGPIYLKADLSLYGTAEEIYLRANCVISKMISEIIRKDLEPVEQKGDPVIFQRRTPDMSAVMEIEDVNNLFDQIRMLDAPGYPKAFIENEYFRFEFSRASLKSNETIIADVRITKK